MGGRGNSSGMQMKTAVHMTSLSNVDSILRNGFDLSRAGEGAGDQWGSGAYFSTEKSEQDFYSGKMSDAVAIQADIDTSQMFTVNIQGKAYSPGNMYDIAASQLPLPIRSEYESLAERTTQRKALSRTISNHYTGLIIHQTGVDGVDGTTGGNQIVVYDTSTIRNLKRKKL